MRALVLLSTVLALQAVPAFASPVTATNSYDVFRNGKNIGTHIVQFEKSGDTLSVETQTKMKVKLLFVTAFSYDYVSTEYWQNGEIVNIESVTKNNSGNIVTQAKRDGDVYHISRDAKGDFEASTISAPIAPTSHWNMAGLKHGFSFDPITAKNAPVSITLSAVPHQEHFTGQRYDVTGEYEYSTYYDAAGNWQGMAFERNGFIEFRCSDCQNTLWPDLTSKAATANINSAATAPKPQLSSYP